jgi:hypothetical protein
MGMAAGCIPLYLIAGSLFRKRTGPVTSSARYSVLAGCDVIEAARKLIHGRQRDD